MVYSHYCKQTLAVDHGDVWMYIEECTLGLEMNLVIKQVETGIGMYSLFTNLHSCCEDTGINRHFKTITTLIYNVMQVLQNKHDCFMCVLYVRGCWRESPLNQ